MHGQFPIPVSTVLEKNTLGYLASALVLCTFSVRSMRMLRCLGIASNVLFISYAWIAGLPPIAILHGLLLPINISRLVQMETESGGTRRRVRAAASSRSPHPRRIGALFGWLVGCMQRSRERAELRQLDYRGRHDLGFTRVLDESGKRCWYE